MAFKLFGLTGGIACGKTTVANFLRDRGLPVIDADVVARDVVAPGSEGLSHIVDAFGKSVLDAQGALDRKKMASIVFECPQARTTLERITHPRIRQRTVELANALAKDGHQLAAYEAALLVENKLHDAFRPLVVVAVDVAIQVCRVMARDKLTEEQAHARLAAQMPIKEKIAVADFVIDSHGSFETVRMRTHEVIRKICETVCIEDDQYF